MPLIFDQKPNATPGTLPKQTIFKKTKEIQTKILKNYLNIVILMILSKKNRLTGYDIFKIILQKQGIRLSVSIIYRVLHSLEDAQIVEGQQDENAKTVYSLTANGRLFLANMLESRKEIERFVLSIFDSTSY